MTQRQITVPKVASQSGNSSLYEILKDVLKRVSARANELDTSISGVSTALTATVPTGSGMLWYTSAAPSGWAICDGSAVHRVGDHAALFALLGTTYGAGDGTTTFCLPDLRQRFPLGKAASGTGSTLADTGGAIDHVHSVDPPSSTSGAPSATASAQPGVGTAFNYPTSTHTHDTNIAAFNSAAANPPYLVINFIVKL